VFCCDATTLPFIIWVCLSFFCKLFFFFFFFCFSSFALVRFFFQKRQVSFRERFAGNDARFFLRLLGDVVLLFSTRRITIQRTPTQRTVSVTCLHFSTLTTILYTFATSVHKPSDSKQKTTFRQMDKMKFQKIIIIIIRNIFFKSDSLHV
jgi:hypothetical protein